MYFHHAEWPGEWITATRKLLYNEFDWSYHFRKDFAQSEANEMALVVHN
jgi:hypothetical protein